MGNGRNYSHKLCCSEKTHKMITQNCKEELRRVHPELKDVEIPHDKILKSMYRHYLQIFEEYDE